MLAYLFLAFIFLVAIGLGFLFPALSLFLYRRYSVGLALVLGVFVLEAAVARFPGIRFGIIFYPQDLVFGLLGGTAILRILFGHGRHGFSGIWAFFGFLLLISFARGLVGYGTAAGVDFRVTFYFWACALYFMTFSYTADDLNRFARWWLLAALGMLCVTIFRWGADAAGIQILPNGPFALSAGAGVPYRVIDAAQANLIGVGIILIAAARMFRVRQSAWQFALPFFVLAIVVLQHRSVWVATFVALTVLLYLERRRLGQMARYLGLSGMVGAAILVPLMAAGKLGSVTGAVGDSASAAFSTRSGTFVGRVEGWKALFGQWNGFGAVDKLIGRPFGSGYARQESGQTVTYSPHNYYVQQLLRVGVLGLFALMLMYFVVARALLRRSKKAGNDPPLPYVPLFALLVGQLAFYIPYQTNYLNGIVLGIAVGLVAASRLGPQCSRTSEVPE